MAVLLRVIAPLSYVLNHYAARYPKYAFPLFGRGTTCFCHASVTHSNMVAVAGS